MQGAVKKRKTTELVVSALAASVTVHPKYRTGGTTLPGLTKALSSQSQEAGEPPPACHLVRAAVAKLEREGLVERSGAGAAVRLKLSTGAVAGLRKLKAAARAIGTFQVIAAAGPKKRKREESSSIPLHSAQAPRAKTGAVRITKLKSAAAVVGKLATVTAAAQVRTRKRQTEVMRAARLARFDTKESGVRSVAAH